MRTCGLFLASLLAGSTASAGLVHGNGTPNHQNAIHSDANVDYENGAIPGISGDDFTLPEQTTIDLFEWWGIYVPWSHGEGEPPAADNWTIQIHGFAGEVPDWEPLYSFNVGHVGRTLTGDFTDVYPEYYFSATIDPITLDAGRYLFSVFNDTTGDGDDFYWASHAASGNSFYRYPISEQWEDELGAWELAFTINAPEPGSLASLAALLGLAACRRRG